MSVMVLEIVEGPGAGRQIPLDGTLELGREGTAIVLDDELVSRRHARVGVESGAVSIEDLGSRNGTFVNGQETHAKVALQAGDQVLVGVTVLELRSPAQVRAQPTAVHAVPAALAAPRVEPDYVGPDVRATPVAAGSPLDRLLDRRVKPQARTATLALFALVALVVLLFVATR